MTDVEVGIKRRYEALAEHLDERQRRLLLAAEARVVGWGGAAAVGRATGASSHTIQRGVEELAGKEPMVEGRVRRPGGGTKRAEERQPGLPAALDRLVEPTTRGDPESPLRWTCKSTRVLAGELQRQGFRVGHAKVAEMLAERGYSLQGNRKVVEGGDHPDRDEQFRTINEKALEFQGAGDPVVSVDAKKKELVGNYKNAGREWHPEGEAPAASVYDFVGEQGKVTPYGVYDVARNEAWVNVGTDHDTAAFAVASIRRWWEAMGRAAYGASKRLFITADGGGSNGSRSRLWKVEIQKFATETGLTVHVSHLPPGTSKWNKIEHRLFSRITQNWRGRPLIRHDVVVGLIASTTSTTGLAVGAGLDTRLYPTGVKVSDEEMERLLIERSDFHGEWNYSFRPQSNNACS